MPDADSPVSEAVGRVVRDLCSPTGAKHRLVEARLSDALKDAPLRRAVLERASRLDRSD
jgi:hypothetical protein